MKAMAGATPRMSRGLELIQSLTREVFDKTTMKIVRRPAKKQRLSLK